MTMLFYWVEIPDTHYAAKGPYDSMEEALEAAYGWAREFIKAGDLRVLPFDIKAVWYEADEDGLQTDRKTARIGGFLLTADKREQLEAEVLRRAKKAEASRRSREKKRAKEQAERAERERKRREAEEAQRKADESRRRQQSQARRGQLSYDDACAILGVPKWSDEKTVKASWKRLAAANHPDRGGDLATMQRINAAYDLVKSYCR